MVAGGEAWNSVRTADIRIRVERGTPGRVPGRNNVNEIIVVDSADRPGIAGFARRWTRRNVRNEWEWVECDIGITTRHLMWLADADNAANLSTVIHEFGHCIGLHHAARGPTRLTREKWTTSVVWDQNPKMAYGLDVDNAIPEDDAVGASLLRPAPGWLATVGSVSGSVTAGGEPAPFVSVHFLRVEGERPVQSIQVFSDEQGTFVGEGLVPGEYLVWIHPIIAEAAHGRLLRAVLVEPRLDDLVDHRLLTVRAGQETVAGAFELRPGRSLR